MRQRITLLIVVAVGGAFYFGYLRFKAPSLKQIERALPVQVDAGKERHLAKMKDKTKKAISAAAPRAGAIWGHLNWQNSMSAYYYACVQEGCSIGTVRNWFVGIPAALLRRSCPNWAGGTGTDFIRLSKR